METWQKFVSGKAAEIYCRGQADGREQVYDYLLKCSADINFGKATPNEVLIGLVEIMRNEDNEVEND